MFMGKVVGEEAKCWISQNIFLLDGNCVVIIFFFIQHEIYPILIDLERTGGAPK